MPTEQAPVTPDKDVTDEDLARLYEEGGGFSGLKNASSEESPDPKTSTEAGVENEKADKTENAETTKAEQKDVESTDEETDEGKPLSEDHKERSKLGRKMKGLSEEVALLRTVITQLTSQTLGGKNSTETQGILPEEPPELISTPEDVFQTFRANPAEFAKLTAMADEVKAKEQKQYEQKFMKQFDSFGETNAAHHKEVWTEFKEKFNSRLSNDPMRDAEVLYNKALVSVLQKKLTPEANALPKRIVASKAPAGP